MDNILPPNNFRIELLNHTTYKEKDGNNVCINDMCRSLGEINHWINGLVQWLLSEKIIDDEYMICNNILYVKPVENSISNTISNTINEIYDTIKFLIKEVQVIPLQDQNSYERLLSDSVIIINLIDASAVNTVLECIMGNIPIIVNRLPALEEVFGVNYPLFYENIEDINKILEPNLEMINQGYTYLTKMDKKKFSMSNFVIRFQKIIMQH